MRVVTFGTYDVFHVGHLNRIKRARALGNELFVGVSSDKMNFNKKGRYPVYPEQERMEIIANLRDVDGVFLEESMALKRQYLMERKADFLVMGDDWADKFDEFNDICRVIYLPRTAGISTTETIQKILRYE
jgi:glycerol-3-phosphate cytidylyltransferase